MAIMNAFYTCIVNNTKGADIMVKLKSHHLKVIEETLILVVEYKDRTLKDRAWRNFSEEWLPKAINQINQNEFEVNHPQRNTFCWLTDQICWSKKLSPGIKPTECIPLADTNLGEECMAICRAAAKGQTAYDMWAAHSKFHDLFV